MKIHHVGYLVSDIDKSLLKFQLLGYKIEKEKIYDEIRDIFIVFIKNDMYRVELIQPVSEKSVAYNLLKKYGHSPYHICYIVKNIEMEVEGLKQQRYVLIDEPCVAPAIEGRRTVFLYNKNVGIIELVEDENNERN